MHNRVLFSVIVLSISFASAKAQTQPRTIKWNNPDRPKIDNVEHKSFKSKSMDQEIGYNVFTPTDYQKGTGRFPVIYFLHGAGGNENSDAAGFSSRVNQAINEKKIPPVICVFPNGGMSGYADRGETKVMGETMIIKELIPIIDADYRTINGQEGRVIGGFSMGGGGAIRLAVKHPDLFTAAASWAGAFRNRGGDDDAIKQAEKNIDQLKGKSRFLLIVGDQDQTYIGHQPVIDAFKKLKIDYEYKVLAGVNHNLGVYHQKTGDQFVHFLGKELKKADK